MKSKFYTNYTFFAALLLLAITIPAIQSCTHTTTTAALRPRPMSEEDEEKNEARKKAYIELIHRAAPGTNWRQIEEQNAIANYFRFKNSAGKTTSSFAGGAINATWHERGNDNIAGRTNAFAYLPTTNTLYAAADGGSIWKTSLPSISWVKVADAAEYNSYVLGVVPRGTTGQRLFLSTSTNIWRTDNDGATFDTSSGLSFPVAWGGNYVYRVIPVNDAAHTIYCVTFGWDAVSWTARFSIYASTDTGVSFHYIRNFAYHNSDQLSFCSPLGSGTLYALGVSGSDPDTLYTINSGAVSITSVTNTFGSGDNNVDMKCVIASGVTHFYALTGGNHVYHSTNFGTKWFAKSTTGTGAYILGVSPTHPEIVSYGGVDAYRSTDSGATWTIINPWGDYYSAVATKLHADLRDFSYFKYASGTELGLVGTDGGAWISNDQLATVNNISLNGLHNSQLWDHITDPNDTNNIIGGAQDQGLQATHTGGGTGIFNSSQVISGDYGQLKITGGNTLWPEYPGGNLYLYNGLSSPSYICTWTMQGTQKPNVGWMLATSEYYTSATQDEILIGGGEISNDSGSYLVKLSLNIAAASVTPTQYNYNFRTHSHNATSGISAIGISHLSNTLLYVAAEDGTFFYSTNAGTSWNITPSFSGVGGSYLYGATILASVDSVDKVYFGGSGYSNPAVYVSRDHGQTFAAMSTGLPPTLVNKLAAYKNDSFVFAATEAGPYVYVKAANRWYSLSEPGTPAVNWRSVEYIKSIGTVRWGTYGRGIWDLVFARPVSHVAVIAPAASAPAVTIAPNPAYSGESITLFSAIQQQAHINLYSINGVNVFSANVNTNERMTLPQVAPGMYVCEVAIGSQMQHTMLMIK